jgi:hypothetical protein
MLLQIDDLTAIGDRDGQHRAVLHVDTHLADLLDDFHTLDDLAEDDMLAIEMRGRLERDEELRLVAIAATVGHRQQTRTSVPTLEILIDKRTTVNRSTLQMR